MPDDVEDRIRAAMAPSEDDVESRIRAAMGGEPDADMNARTRAGLSADFMGPPTPVPQTDQEFLAQSRQVRERQPIPFDQALRISDARDRASVGNWNADDVEAVRGDKARRTRIADEFGQAAARLQVQTGRPVRSGLDPNNDDDLREMAEFIQRYGGIERAKLEAADPGWFARIVGAPMRGALSPLRLAGVDIDLAKGSDSMRGKGADYGRATAGGLERLAETVGEVGGMALTGGAFSKGIQALGVAPRAASIASMAGLGVSTAPEGERLEGAATMTALGILGGKFEQRIGNFLPKLPLGLRSYAAAGGGNALAGALLGQTSPDEVVSNLVLGAVMRAVDSRPDITEADLRREAIAAVQAARADKALDRNQRIQDVETAKINEAGRAYRDRLAAEDALATAKAPEAGPVRGDGVVPESPVKIDSMEQPQPVDGGPKPDTRAWPEAGRVAYEEALNLAQSGKQPDDVRRHLYRLPTEELVASAELVGLRTEGVNRRELIYGLAEAAQAEASIPGGPERAPWQPPIDSPLGSRQPGAAPPPASQIESPLPRVEPARIAPPEPPRAVAPEPVREAPTDAVEARGSLGPLKAPTETLARRTGELARDVARGTREWFGSMLGTLRQSKNPTARQFGEQAQRVVDRSKAERGAMRRAKEAVQGLFGWGSMRPGGGRVALTKPVIGPDGVAYSRLHGLIEGWVAPSSKFEQRVAEAFRQLVVARGRRLQAGGIQRIDPKTGTYTPFVERGDGKVAPRISTPEFVAGIEKGGEFYEAMVGEFVKVGIPEAKVRAKFDEMRESMRGDNPGATERESHAEFPREWPKVPGFVPFKGEKIPILVTDGHAYAEALVNTAADRIAYVSELTQGLKGEHARHRKAVVDKGGVDPDQYREMMRMLAGMPATESMVKPGGAVDKTRRILGGPAAVMQAGLLSKSAIPNIPESLGAQRTFLGTGRWLKAMGDTLASLVPGTKARAEIERLKDIGAVTADAPNMVFDLNRPWTSGWKLLATAIHRLHPGRALNEFQERSAALGASSMGKRLQAGKGGEVDVNRLEQIGYSRADAERLAAGRGTQAEYDGIARRAPAALHGANQHPAEKSWLENRRPVKSLFKFTGYPLMKMRSVARVGRAYLETAKRVATDKGLTPAERASQLNRATQAMVGTVAGTAASGAVAYFLNAWATGGGQGVSIASEEMKDRPVEMATDFLTYATLVGPMQTVMRDAKDGASAREALSNLSASMFPVFLALELTEATTGAGRYRDMNTGDKWSQFAKRFYPAAAVWENGLAAAPWSDSKFAVEANTAIKGYWRWRRAYGLVDDFSTRSQDDQGFRLNMRLAGAAIRRGAPVEEVHKHLHAAYGVATHGGSSVAASLGNRLFLVEPDGTPSRELKGKMPALPAETLAILKALDDATIGYMGTAKGRVPAMPKGERIPKAPQASPFEPQPSK